jgi:5,10-methylenetetrahydrofolate reductase
MEAKEIGVGIMLGLMPFKNAQAAHAMNNVPGIRLPEALMQRVDGMAGDDLSELSIRHCLQIAEGTAGLVAGFHVVSGAHPKLGLALSRVLANGVCKR